MVTLGSGSQRELRDYMLSRYAYGEYGACGQPVPDNVYRQERKKKRNLCNSK